MRVSTCLLTLAGLASAASAVPASAADGTNAALLRCDASITKRFKPDAETKVILVKAFKKNDAFPAPQDKQRFDPSAPPLVANADLCLVKLLVGPGHPGPASAPSTSSGIGIEVWLPTKTAWNGRLHAVGGSGWAGTEEADPQKISSYTISSDLSSAPFIAGKEGAVTASTDTGHTGGVMNGAFAMNPDGTINTTLWEDFSSRAIHLQVVMAKALARAYYGVAPKYTYWDGLSTGGRQALKQAQRYPADFDGILAVVPGINWSRFLIANVYPQIVIQRDLNGRRLTADQLDLVSNAAIGACDVVDGKHLGFVLDNAACRYDPTKDKAVLCPFDGGRNATAACVTRRQALAINKIWYGMTADGSVPDPMIDNGISPLGGKRKWYGLARGTNLSALAGDSPFPIAADMLALALQDPKFATPSFRNATGNGENGWKALTYERLAQAFDAGVALQSRFGDINTDDPDLTAFKARGGRLIHVLATNDELVPYLGSVDYVERMRAKMGGRSGVDDFYRFYLIPGMAHGARNGTTNTEANPPLPGAHKGEFYALMTKWVETGAASENVVLRSLSDKPVSKSLPVCAYPSKPTFHGGDITTAASYTCK